MDITDILPSYPYIYVELLDQLKMDNPLYLGLESDKQFLFTSFKVFWI